jgi:hypothetical protein
MENFDVAYFKIRILNTIENTKQNHTEPDQDYVSVSDYIQEVKT